MAVLRGQQHRVHQGQGIRGAAWAPHRDAQLELRRGARGHRGDAVRTGNPRGLLSQTRNPRWPGAASCIASHPWDGHRVSLTSAVADGAGHRGTGGGC
jgi:hypothetical protein